MITRSTKLWLKIYIEMKNVPKTYDKKAYKLTQNKKKFNKFKI